MYLDDVFLTISFFANEAGVYGLPCGRVAKHTPASAGDAGDWGSLPRLGKPPGAGNNKSPQYSCLRNPVAEEPGRLHAWGCQRGGRNWASERTNTLWGIELENKDKMIWSFYSVCVSKHTHIPGSSVVKDTLAKQTTQVLSLGWEDPLKKLPYSCLGNPRDRGAWWFTIQGVARVRYNLVIKQTKKDLSAKIRVFSYIEKNMI